MLEHPSTRDMEPLIQKVSSRKRRDVDDDASEVRRKRRLNGTVRGF